MKNISAMQPNELYHALLASAQSIEWLFTDTEVLEKISEAQRNKDELTSFSLFASTIAPVLFDNSRQLQVSNILSAFGSVEHGELSICDAFHLFVLDRDFLELASMIKCYGARKIIAALYMYGAPPHFSALGDVLQEWVEKEAWHAYMGDITSFLLKAWCKKDVNIPMYSDFIKKQRPALHDGRSERDVLSGVKSQLAKRIKQRKDSK